eukprot:TRINITY_DN5426_c0_g2_i1.p1 TRINITY_DN5426_c0_g2~~TRINITY_DN5426_c0_g2_i1.p1  ORF type:complete len:236 (+),score=22.76 TRINITY_DN5426_c0_g2_i1:52-759(+)
MGPWTLHNKVVVVTGANRGLGLEWCRQLLQKNNKVIGCVRNPQSADKLQSLQGEIQITQLDTSDEQSIKDWAASLKNQVQHVDVVINNAGIVGERQPFGSVSSKGMLDAFTTNTLGPVMVSQHLFTNKLIGMPSSLIVNVTSKMGSIDDNGSGGSYTYRASKSALNIINKSMSIDLAEYGITSVLLHPGWVMTDMTQNRGLITAEQSVAGMMDVLQSDRELNGCWYDYAGKPIQW